jgi:hypothetical protein
VARGTYCPHSWLTKLRGHSDVLRLICGGLWLPQRPPREVVELRRQVRVEYKTGHEWKLKLEAAEVRIATLERERDEAVRQAAAAQAEARAARGREKAQGAESDARVEEARQMVVDLKKEFDRQLAVADWAHRKEMNTTISDWQQRLDRHEAATVERLRDQDVETRDEKQRMAGERAEARAEAAERAQQVEHLQAQLGQLQVALERVRETSKAGLLDQVAVLQQKVRELGARRTLNQRRLGDANLDRRRANVAQEQTAAESAATKRADQLEKQACTPTLPHPHALYHTPSLPLIHSRARLHGHGSSYLRPPISPSHPHPRDPQHPCHV